MKGHAAGGAGTVRRQQSDEEWTAGRIQVVREIAASALLNEVRVARNEGFDRLVFVFDSENLPGYLIEYVDSPVRECGSGNVAEIAGDGWLSMRFSPARSYDEAGQPTVKERDQRHELPVVRQLRVVCDFEGELEWVAGVGSPNRFRVMELRGPARVVVDIRQ